MNSRQLQQIKEVYEAAAECAPARCAALLDQLCADDAEVRAEVEALLQLIPAAENFIEHPPAVDAALLKNITQTLPPGRRLGPYEVLGELGRGGMGVVYLAVRADDAYRKQVAIKLVWPGYDSSEVARRFHQERQILANLDHPNITRLLDGGATEEGWPYVVMEYVEGQPLHHYCNAQQLSVNERLTLFQQVCAAVEYAHQHFVVHRDLKPSNILVTKSGRIKLLDFGIAKILDPALRPDATSLTHTGLHALTPEYASPEQVRGGEITAASDVYSLGVVLYELLTGQQPYRFPSRALPEVLRVIAEEEPLRPSQVCSAGFDREKAMLPAEAGATNAFTNAHENTPDKLRRRLTGDLDKIILKALRKEPEQRYASVEQLSADLARHLAGAPVLAQAPTLRYRAGKFLRRHPTSLAVTLTLLLALLAALGYAIRQARHERERAREQRREFYAAQLPRAAEDWERDNIKRMNETLARFIPQTSEEELRGFEWQYLWRLSHGERFTFAHEYPYTTAHFQQGPAGRPQILTSSRSSLLSHYLWRDENARCLDTIWDARSGQLLHRYDMRYGKGCINWFDFDQEPIEVAQGFVQGDYAVQLVELHTRRIQRSFSNPTRILATHQLSKHLFAMGDETGTVTVWDLRTGERLQTLPGHRGPIQRIFTFQDKTGLIVLSGDTSLTLWRWSSSTRLLTLHEAEPIGWVGQMLNYLLLHTGATLQVRAIPTGQLLGTLRKTEATVHWVQLDRSGTRVFLGLSNGTIQMYALPSLRLLKTFTGHTGWIERLVISPDNQWLLTGSNDHTARLWEIANGRQRTVLRGHTGDILSTSFSADGAQLLTSDNDHTVKLWNLAEVLQPEQILCNQGKLYGVAFAPDGRRLATAGEDHTIKLWDAQTGQPLQTLTGHTGQVLHVTFSPAGRQLASSGEKSEAKVWDLATGRTLFNLTGHTAQIHTIAYAPDGRMLATASDDYTVRLWDAATGKELAKLPGHTHNVWAVAFSVDGQQLASGDFNGYVYLWEVATGRLLAHFQAHERAVWSLRFSASGTRLLTGSQNSTAKLWDLATQRPLVTYAGHSDEIFEALFTPDERRVVTASNDKTLKIWDAATGRELLTLDKHTDQVWSAAFAPDGLTLVSAGWDGTVRLWRAARPTPSAF
jgi:WD40 repeat protein/serine/threonine protein kinase